jgi:hypothetical protein
MTHTEKLNLPQWEAADAFQREDFNAAFAALDAGYGTALGEALATDRLFVLGEYMGNGDENWYEIELGFRPRFVITTAQKWVTTIASSSNWEPLFRFAIVGENNTYDCLTLTDNGFAVRKPSYVLYPDVNHLDIAYSYIAFR